MKFSHPGKSGAGARAPKPGGLPAASLGAKRLNRNHEVGRENFNAKAQIRTNYRKTLRVGRQDAKRILSLAIRATKRRALVKKPFSFSSFASLRLRVFALNSYCIVAA
jgi:hypothetical protein